MADLIFLLIPVVFVAFVGLFIYALKANKKHMNGLAQWAAARQWVFSPVAPKTLTDDLTRMTYFADSQGKVNCRVLSGLSAGKHIHIFEHVVHGDGDSALDDSTSTSTVYGAVYIRGDVSLPQFTVHPRSMLIRMPHFDFDTHAAFTNKWFLHGPDEAAVRRLFTPEVLTYCESMKADVVAGDGERLVIMRRGGWVFPQHIDGLLQDALALDELLRKSARSYAKR